MEFEFQIYCRYKGFGREESEKEKRDFRRDFGGGACGQSDFRRHFMVVKTRCLKVLIKKVMTPLPLVGMILRVKSLVNMFVLKGRVPRQRVW
ncbi:unnamed protein product [Prunus armeniaca]